MPKELFTPIYFPEDNEIEPVLRGDHGRAWLCDTSVGLVKMNLKPEQDATICHWVVEAPAAHPAWHSYSLHCQHLRPMPGHEIKFYLDGATHEMVVFALNPRLPRRGMIEDGIVAGRWLTPPNFAVQFIESNDDDACERVKKAVQEILDGKLSPDTDYRAVWAARFGSNMLKQAGFGRSQ
jgi:hypothetical protein